MTCFVLGSGPSLTRDDCERLRGAKIIAVNCSVLFAPFADLLFFSDTQWFVRFRREVESFAGMIVTTSEKAAVAGRGRIHLVSAEYHSSFPAPGSRFIRESNNSGFRAISLAHAMGARRIVLIGFDMAAVDGRTHFHDYYRNDPKRYPEHFMPGIRGWSADAEATGVSIVNATQNSELAEFRAVRLVDELPGLAA